MLQRRSSSDPLVEPNPEPERLLGKRARRRKRMAQEDAMEALRRQLHEMTVAKQELQIKVDAVPKNAQQYMHPELHVPKSAIVLPAHPQNYEIKTQFITLIRGSTFEGRMTECPIAHVKIFLDMCDTITSPNVTAEYIRLKSFKWSLCGRALAWLESLPPQSIFSWQQLHDLFMTKFFPPAKTTEMRLKITGFKQFTQESLLDAWERFKDMIAKCPTHGQPDYVLQQIFFMGMDAQTRARINLQTSCAFLDMEPKEAFALLDKLTNYDAMYETPYHTPSSSRGLYEVSPEVDLEVRAQAKADETNKLKRQLDQLKACQICHLKDHNASTCPNREQFNAAESYMAEEAKYFQRSYPPRNNAYNNRAKFPAQEQRSEPYRPPGYQEPPHPTQMEDLIRVVMDMSKTMEKNQRATTEGLQNLQGQVRGVNAHLNDLEAWKKGVDTQLATLSQQVPRAQGQLPAHPEENPRGHIAAVTLRGGKSLPEPSTKPQAQKEVLPRSLPTRQDRAEGKDQGNAPSSSTTKSPTDSALQPADSAQIPTEATSPPVVIPTLPFPKKRKAKDASDVKFHKFIKILKDLSLHIPFTEVLEEMPAYAKFLKEVLAKKRVIPESINNVTESCALINKAQPEKLKDPGRFAITIGIGNHRYKALCDLGASASLLPLSIWRKINMGDLTPIDMRLFMAYGSCVYPTGMVKDLPVEIEDISVPNDFVVMEMPEDPFAPIILGRPFLATVGAIINVKKAQMTFEIGNETVEFHFNKTMKECMKIEEELSEGWYEEEPGEATKEISMGSPEPLEDPNPPSSLGYFELKKVEGNSRLGRVIIGNSKKGERFVITRPSTTSRGRTPFNWKAFDEEMEERARPGKNHP